MGCKDIIFKKLKMGKLFFIMWVAWAWKWTLINNLKELNDDNFVFPLSYRSRAIRENEVNWIDSWFISRIEFEKGIEKGVFLEYAIVHWLDYYGTKYEDVINSINAWKIVIKELDMWGLKKLLKENQEFRKYYKTIFLSIPPVLIKERIEMRWAKMTDEELKRRLESARIESKDSKKLCNYVIDTSDKTPEEVLEEVRKIINNKS